MALRHNLLALSHSGVGAGKHRHLPARCIPNLGFDGMLRVWSANMQDGSGTWANRLGPRFVELLYCLACCTFPFDTW